MILLQSCLIAALTSTRTCAPGLDYEECAHATQCSAQTKPKNTNRFRYHPRQTQRLGPLSPHQSPETAGA